MIVQVPSAGIPVVDSKLRAESTVETLKVIKDIAINPRMREADIPLSKSFEKKRLEKGKLTKVRIRSTRTKGSIKCKMSESKICTS